MARSKKVTEDKPIHIQFRLSQFDYDFILEYCSLYNLSVPDYFRKLIKLHRINLGELDNEYK